jgi:HPt (histidine-containing phosphotransfer) domain-containing protein
LPQQPVGVFVCAALPGTVGITDVDFHIGGHTEGFVLGHFVSSVPGQRSAQGDANVVDPSIRPDHAELPLVKVIEKWLIRKVHEPRVEDPIKLIGDGMVRQSQPAGMSAIHSRERFLERMMGDEDFAREIVIGFMKELPSLISTLREHVACADLESIRKQAHKLKGSAANVGGDALRDMALQVEEASKAGNIAEVVRLFADLEFQASQLNEALKRWAG